jgi:hypothetical protein
MERAIATAREIMRARRENPRRRVAAVGGPGTSGTTASWSTERRRFRARCCGQHSSRRHSRWCSDDAIEAERTPASSAGRMASLIRAKRPWLRS